MDFKALFQSILEFFLPPADPTRRFDPVSEPVELVWDFDRKTLNGHGFGESIEMLRPFGPADHYEIGLFEGSFDFTYANLGLFINFDRGNTPAEFEYFGVLTGPDKHSEKNGPITHGCLKVTPGDLVIDARTPRSLFDDLFGEPEDIDIDDDEEIRLYEFDGIDYELEFEPKNGPLKRINVFPSDP